MKCIKILKYSGISRAVAAVLKNKKHLEKFSERSTEADLELSCVRNWNFRVCKLCFIAIAD